MKKIIIVLVFLLAAGYAFSHDKGDLMLNIEPQIGFAIPEIGVKYNYDPIYRDFPDSQSIGFDWALKFSFHYYFLDFFGINTGIGLTGNISTFQAVPINKNYSNDNYDSSYNDVYIFSSTYFTIPIGFRFSLQAFAIGGGLTVNIPMPLSGRVITPSEMPADDIRLNSYLGWYFDFGFDISGIHERTGGFGMLLRLGGSFTDQIIYTNNKSYSYDPFRQFNISLVFQAAAQLASLPIGEK